MGRADACVVLPCRELAAHRLGGSSAVLSKTRAARGSRINWVMSSRVRGLPDASRKCTLLKLVWASDGVKFLCAAEGVCAREFVEEVAVHGLVCAVAERGNVCELVGKSLY